MADVLQITFTNAFSREKIFVFWWEFNWSLFLSASLPICHIGAGDGLELPCNKTLLELISTNYKDAIFSHWDTTNQHIALSPKYSQKIYLGCCEVKISAVYTKFAGRLSEEPFPWLIQKFPCLLILKTEQPGCQLNLSEGQIRLDLLSQRPLV